MSYLFQSNYCEYQITAVIHDVNKYNQVEDPSVAPDLRTVSTLIAEAPSPSNASTEEIVVLNNRAVSNICIVEPVLGVKECLVEFQFEKIIQSECDYQDQVLNFLNLH